MKDLLQCYWFCNIPGKFFVDINRLKVKKKKKTKLPFKMDDIVVTVLLWLVQLKSVKATHFHLVSISTISEQTIFRHVSFYSVK